MSTDIEGLWTDCGAGRTRRGSASNGVTRDRGENRHCVQVGKMLPRARCSTDQIVVSGRANNQDIS